MGAALLPAVAAVGIGAAGAAASLALPAGSAGPAAAEPLGDCSTTTGVIVVVDFSNWGGSIERGCAATPTTGYDALHAAGFTTAGDTSGGTAFVCRIDTYPTPAQTPCTSTPPASAYWSYWYADAGQTSWSYAQLGAMTYKPPPGSVTAWVFGPNQPPFTPTSVRAANAGPNGGGTTTTTAPPSTTTTAPPTVGSGAAPSSSSSSSSSSSAGRAPSATGAGSGTSPPAGAKGGSPAATGTSSPGAKGAGTNGAGPSSGPSTAPASSPTTATGPTGRVTARKRATANDGRSSRGARASATPKIVEVNPASARATSSPGSPLSAVIGAAVVLALAGGGGAIAWRRRRASRAG